jgi:hypothetical protein
MHKYTVELRIEGDFMVPSTVTKDFGLTPCLIIESGVKRKKETALWAYNGVSDGTETAKEWDSLEEGILNVANKLMPKLELIRAYSDKYEVYWWCGHFQQCFDGGPSFSPELFRMLADIGVPLYLDNYFSNPDEE